MNRDVEKRQVIDFISEYMLSKQNSEGIDEVGIESVDPTNPDGEQVVRVFYSAPDAPHPPNCSEYISEGLKKMKITGLQVEYVHGSSIEVY